MRNRRSWSMSIDYLITLVGLAAMFEVGVVVALDF
jgi:hypothetical protein